MYGFRKKYQRNEEKGDNIKETTTTTTKVIQTKIERPKVIKVEEQTVIKEKDYSLQKNKYSSRLAKAPGRASAVFSLKRDNDLIIKTTVRGNSKEKDRPSNKEKEIEKDKEKENEINDKKGKYSTKPNYRWSVVEQKVEREPFKWKRYNRKKEEEKTVEKNENKEMKTIKEEKPVEKNENKEMKTIKEEKPVEKNENKEMKTIKEEKIEKTPDNIKTTTTITKTTITENKNNEKEPEEKIVKTEVTIVESKIEPPKEELNIKKETPKIINNQNTEKETKKSGYKYRSKIRPNKTDEDLPLPKKKEEEVKIEAKKRRTLATTFIPGSRKFLEEKKNKNNNENNNGNKNNNENKNNDENKNNNDNENNNEKEYKSENKNKIIKEEKIEEKIDEKIEEDVNENENEQKEKINKLKIALNEIEKASAEKLLKKDLVELFEKVLESNLGFKDDIFFKNLNDTAKKVGNMDKKEISHTYKEIETKDIIRSIDNADSLLKKYTTKARRIVEED